MSGCSPLGLSRQPTAHNPVAGVPPIAISVLSVVAVASLGLATGVHVPPDSFSISVRRVPSAARWKPAAHALPSARVSTPVRSASLGKLPVEASDHCVPSQPSASGWYVPPTCAYPTAHPAPGIIETPLRALFPFP